MKLFLLYGSGLMRDRSLPVNLRRRELSDIRTLNK